MEKARRLKTFSIVALIVAVLGLTIAFAALSKTLTINGTGTVDAANWDIHFKNISEPTLTGKATTTGTPTLADNGATINDMKVSLKEPGDKVVYTVDIENSGDINAEIDSILLPTFTTAQSNILDFKAVYTSNNKEISEGDILESKETKNVTITIMYKDITDESLLPKEGISVNLKYELRFIQTDKASGSSSQGGNNPTSSYGVAIASRQITDTITATYYGGEEQENGTYKDGTLVISGTGEIPNDSYETLLFLIGAPSLEELENNSDKYLGEDDEPIWKYGAKNLVIEDGITKIGDYSLSSIPIENVILPNSLLTIGSGAFSNTFIAQVKIPASVTNIGNCAFQTFNDNIIIRYENGSTTLWADATYDNNTKYVYLPSTISRIGSTDFASMSEGAIIYCETQEVADLVRSGTRYWINGNASDTNVKFIVDPSKF